MKAARLPASSLLQYTQCRRQFVSSLLPKTPTLAGTSPRAFTSSRIHFATVEVDTNSSEIDELVDNQPPLQAAQEIKFEEEKRGQAIDPDKLPSINARIVPESPSYFTGSPIFTDSLLKLREILREHATIPTVKSGEQPRVAWRDIVDYRNMVGEEVPNGKYSKVIRILQRLNMINPALMPKRVKDAIDPFKRDINPLDNKTKPIEIDEYGRAMGNGRRKSSTARAVVVEGTGEVLVNGKPLTEQFARIHDRESVVWALKATDRMDKYNIWAKCNGGGTTGQAEALALAVSKALMAHEPLLKPALRRAGVVTRDPRGVERKKPGHVKARKMPAWVKR